MEDTSVKLVEAFIFEQAIDRSTYEERLLSRPAEFARHGEPGIRGRVALAYRRPHRLITVEEHLLPDTKGHPVLAHEVPPQSA